MKYIVIARVANREYLTKVEAESLLSAEHLIIDNGVCTKFGYGVDGACAYDAKTMKTDSFIGSALGAEPIAYLDLVDIIRRHNENLKEKVAAEETIRKNKKLLAEMWDKIAELENEIAEAKEKIA